MSACNLLHRLGFEGVPHVLQVEEESSDESISSEEEEESQSEDSFHNSKKGSCKPFLVFACADLLSHFRYWDPGTLTSACS